jgi:hypothetical protein
MLSGLALFNVAQDGIGLSDWIILEFLYTSLLGNKQDPFERKDSKELELSLLLKVVLLSGTWMGLEEKREIPQDVQKLLSLSKWVPKKRTFSSWLQSYSLNKFIEVRIVPLDVLFERSKGTIRYSSYCKGYGESSHMGHRQKTRPSVELDGEETDRPEVYISSLSELQLLLDLVILDIHEQASKETEKR